MVLPSNSSPHLYRDNTTSQFKIDLAQPCDLHGKWQIALLEVQYPNTVFNVQKGANWIRFYDVSKEIEQLKLSDGPEFRRESHPLSISDFSSAALKFEYEVEPGMYTTISSLIRAVKRALQPIRNCVPGAEPDFKIDVHEGKLYICDLPDLKLSCMFFAPRLSLLLGLPYSGPYTPQKRINAVRGIDLSLGRPEVMFIYSNIIQDQVVGHTRAPLMRVVPMKIDSKFGSMSNYTCENPIYLDLATKSFGELEVHIRTDTGDLVPFHHGTLTLLCHFKQVI